MGLARQDGAAGKLVENIVLLFQYRPNQFLPGIDPQAVENQDHGLLTALGRPNGVFSTLGTNWCVKTGGASA